jgi:hypothetical protein
MRFILEKQLWQAVVREVGNNTCVKASKPVSNPSNRRFDSTTQLAQWLGKTPRYAAKLADKRLIPYMALPGRDRLFDREKVLEALARFEVRAVGQ